MTGFNGFSIPTNPSSSFSSSSFLSASSSASQINDEATIKKIIEAVEVLEKLAKEGAFPQQKLQEIKKELEKKYPNIFSSQNNSQKPENNCNQSSSSSNPPNLFPDNSPWAFANPSPSSTHPFSSNLFNEQEFYKNYIQAQQQQMMYNIQAQNQMTEQLMKIYGVTTPGLTTPIPNYGVTFPSYDNNNIYGNMSGEPLNMVLHIMGTGNHDLNTTLQGGSSFGSHGLSAFSFLGSLLGGFGL